MSSIHKTDEIRSLADLAKALDTVERPVLLVEGIRALPMSENSGVVAMGVLLAKRLPGVTFRSGNAKGTDTAFAEGVTAVDPARMEYVVTHEGMGRKRRQPGCRTIALDQLPNVADGPVGENTVRATPNFKGLVEAYRARGKSGPLGAKTVYLLRDTLKVVGATEVGLLPATAGMFYVNESKPLSGGTGHTIRVCLQQNVRVVFQEIWRQWLE